MYAMKHHNISDIPASAREYLNKYGVNSLVYFLVGPRPNKPVMWGDPHIPGYPEWRVYSILRARGIPALRAYKTIKYRGAIPVFLAVFLIERYGRDKAELLLKGALDAPFGIQRVIDALGVPRQLFPERNSGSGFAAGESFRILRETFRAMPYLK